MPDLLDKAKPYFNAIPKNAKYFADNQFKTLKSVIRLDSNIYMLDYKNDYFLDEVLENGVKNLGELIAFAAKKMTFGVNLFEIGDGDFGCSTFDAFTPDGSHMLGRNFDFREAPCFVVWTHPKNAYRSVAVADCNFMVYGNKYNRPSPLNRINTLLAPYTCVDGINEKGLAIAVLQIKTKATNQTDPGKKDITTTAIIRAVLDKCATVDEAIEMFKKYNMHDSLFTRYHYQIIDREKSVVIEYVGDRLNVIDCNSEIYADNNLESQYVSNYYVTKDYDDDRCENHGMDRMQYVINTLTDSNCVMTETEAMDLLSRIKLNYDHPKYPWRIVSLWSAVYNSEKLTLKLAANIDYKKIYTFNVFEPYQVHKKESLENDYKLEWEY